MVARYAINSTTTKKKENMIKLLNRIAARIKKNDVTIK